MLPSADNARDHLLVFINGERHEVVGRDVFLTLSDYLRLRLGLIGTKIVCSEGDCGACSVLVGKQDIATGKLVYRAVDSCILFMFQLDRTHVVSVEGLKRNGLLSPVQEAMVAHHGSQCGFCTPGFITTMTGLLENESADRTQPLSPDELRCGLSGNLCRCTGYLQIIDAGHAMDLRMTARLCELYPDGPILGAFTEQACKDIHITDDGRTVAIPGSLNSAVAYRAEHPGCTIVAGATDLGVQHNKGMTELRDVLCLTSVNELREISRDDSTLTLGACVDWSRVENHVQTLIPELHKILTIFGSPQIRHSGTIGGNIANASPIADSLPCLYVLNAELELIGPAGTRRVNVNDFYHGYKQFDLQPDELIARVHLPLPSALQMLRLYKVSRRRDLDISTFTAALLMEIDGADQTIRHARIALGGVAPIVLRLPKTEAFVVSKPWNESTMREAGAMARTEITPITDVRGSAEYRMQLAENILMKFYFDCIGEPVTT